MKIRLYPIIPNNLTDRILYEIDGDVITATLNGVTDTFDFTGAPEGILETIDPETGKDTIETELDINPIRAAKKTDGELYVTLRHFVGPTAEELTTPPEWMNAEDYTPPELPEEQEAQPDEAEG